MDEVDAIEAVGPQILLRDSCARARYGERRHSKEERNPHSPFSAKGGDLKTTWKVNALVIVIHLNGFVKRPRPRRANLVARGLITVNRSDSEMKRNAEIGLSTKSSKFLKISIRPSC
jgi:hypothetical protein